MVLTHLVNQRTSTIGRQMQTAILCKPNSADIYGRCVSCQKFRQLFARSDKSGWCNSCLNTAIAQERLTIVEFVPQSLIKPIKRSQNRKRTQKTRREQILEALANGCKSKPSLMLSLSLENGYFELLIKPLVDNGTVLVRRDKKTNWFGLPEHEEALKAIAPYARHGTYDSEILAILQSKKKKYCSLVDLAKQLDISLKFASELTTRMQRRGVITKLRKIFTWIALPEYKEELKTYLFNSADE